LIDRIIAMNNRPTYALIVLFFGGLLALWWAGRAEIPTIQDEATLGGLVLPRLYRAPEAEVRRVELAGGEGPPVTIERRAGDEWQLVEPVDALADRGRVAGLLRSLKTLRKSRDAGDISGPPETYGLGKPRTVKLYAGGQSEPLAVLEVGAGTRLAGLRYVRPAGGAIAVVDALPLESVDLAPAAWRQRSLFTVSTLDASRLGVGGPGRVLKAEREGGKWRLREPVRAPADEAKVYAVLADLGALRVEDDDKGFIADGVRDWSKYGLDAPEITLELAGGAPAREASQTVLISRPLPNRADRAYARRADQDEVVLVNPKALADLGRNPNALRSHKVADFDRAKVNFIAVREGENEHDLARTAAGWVVARREGDTLRTLGRADGPAVQALIAKLDALETAEFLDPKAYPEAGVDRPGVTVKLWQARTDTEVPRSDPAPPQGEPAVDLALGRRDAASKTAFARTAGDPAALLALPDNVLDVFPSGPLAYRDRSILAQDRFGFARFVIRREGREVTLQAPAAAQAGPEAFGRWRMTRPVEAPADADSIARLAVLLSALRAESLVAQGGGTLKAYGLDSPALSVSWTSRSGSRQPGRTLAVGKEVPGGNKARYATVSGNPLIFALPGRSAEILDAEFHDRRVLEFPPERARRVELRWPGRTIELDRDPQSSASSPSWVGAPDADLAGFEVARVKPLVESLARLMAARFVQFAGPLPASSGLNAPAFSVRVFLDGELAPRELHVGAPAPRLHDEAARFATPSAGVSGPVFLLTGPLWDQWAEPPGRGAGELPADVFAPAP